MADGAMVGTSYAISYTGMPNAKVALL